MIGVGRRCGEVVFSRSGVGHAEKRARWIERQTERQRIRGERVAPGAPSCRQACRVRGVLRRVGQHGRRRDVDVVHVQPDARVHGVRAVAQPHIDNVRAGRRRRSGYQAIAAQRQAGRQSAVGGPRHRPGVVYCRERVGVRRADKRVWQRIEIGQHDTADSQRRVLIRVLRPARGSQHEAVCAGRCCDADDARARIRGEPRRHIGPQRQSGRQRSRDHFPGEHAVPPGRAE